MSSESFDAILSGTTTARTTKQDLESFGWVFIYGVFLHCLSVLADVPPGVRNTLKRAWSTVFSSSDIGTLRDRRPALFGTTVGGENLQNLLRFLHSRKDYRPLGPLVVYVWNLLARMQPPPSELPMDPDDELAVTFALLRAEITPPPHVVTYDNFLDGFKVLRKVYKDREAGAERQTDHAA